MALLLPEYLQTKKSPAARFRQVNLDKPLQSGVVGLGDMLVTQRGAGANMSVDVAAGAAFVRGTVTSRQGLYHAYNDAAVNLTIATNASGNPRVDQIVLHIYDSVDGADAQDNAIFEVVQGTATAGATLDNRNGAASIPNSSIRIADVLVANGAATIPNSVIRDRRPWARGFMYSRRGDASGSHTTASASLASVAAGYYDGRFEKGENSSVEILFECEQSVSAIARLDMALNIISRSGTTLTRLWRNQIPTASASFSELFRMRSDLLGGANALTPDTYTWTVQWAITTGTATMVNTDVRLNPVITVRETPIPAQLSNNFTP